MDVPDEAAVRSSLYNWLGFGNPNGKYWFIGREESISLSKCAKLNDLTDYFERRREFEIATDLRWTWEEVFGRDLSTFSVTTWHYQIAFLLAFHGEPITSTRVKTLFSEDPQFCRPFSNHFSGEFFPCPKSSKETIAPYSHIWESVEAYHEEVAPRRIEAFSQTLERNPDVDWIITYSPTFVKYLTAKYDTRELTRWSDVAMDPLILSELSIPRGRSVYLLETPFLGYGRIGYDAIEEVVTDITSEPPTGTALQALD